MNNETVPWWHAGKFKDVINDVLGRDLVPSNAMSVSNDELDALEDALQERGMPSLVPSGVKWSDLPVAGKKHEMIVEGYDRHRSVKFSIADDQCGEEERSFLHAIGNHHDDSRHLLSNGIMPLCDITAGFVDIDPGRGETGDYNYYPPYQIVHDMIANTTEKNNNRKEYEAICYEKNKDGMIGENPARYKLFLGNGQTRKQFQKVLDGLQSWHCLS